MTASTETTRTWELTPLEYALTRDKVGKINGRATKRGFTGHFTLTGTDREIVTKDAAGLERTSTVIDAVLTGEAPCYNGWTFLAAVDSVETEAGGIGFVVRTAPGVEESGVDRSVLAPGYCAHCKAKRGNRKYTYLVANDETGELMQVGSTCIRDFLGWEGRPVFVYEDDLLDEIDGIVGSGRGMGRAEFSPETVVTVALAATARFGWVSVTTARMSERAEATRSRVDDYLYGAQSSRRKVREAAEELQRELAPHMAEAKAKAKTIIPALVEGLGDGDYAENLKVCLSAATVPEKYMGLVVSAGAAYDNMTAKDAEREARRAEQKARQEAREERAATSEFAGEEGEKITVEGTVTRLLSLESEYGEKKMVILESGNVTVKTFTTAAWVWEVGEGEEVTLTGTVKAHEVYEGIKQTVIVRPKRV